MDLNETADALVRLNQTQGNENDVQIKSEEETSNEEKEGLLTESTEEVETEQDQTGKIKIEVDGQEIEVDQDELLKGYKEYLKGETRQENLTKSFQEAAEIRKAAEAKTKEFDALLPVVKEYEERLAILDRVLEAPPVDFQTLTELLNSGDTEEYLRKKNELELWQNKKVAVQQQQQQVRQLLSEAQLKQMQAQQAHERELLFKNYPDLKKPENHAKLSNYLTQVYGYTPQDLAMVIDHRNFMIADKARKYDELQAKASESKKVPNTPKVIKKGAATVPVDYKQDGYKRAFNQLRSSGSVNDAAELLLLKSKNNR
jgi:hypothetical protein